MDVFEVVLIALGLALDAAAVSLAAAASGYVNDARAAFRLSFHFGLFQFFMPVMGWMIGRSVIDHISSVDHWIAFGLLTLVGVKMIRTGLGSSKETLNNDPSRGLTLIVLSVATSIDALAIGLSIALLEVSIWYASVVIGTVTGSLCLLAIRLGRRIGDRAGHRMETIGGLILVAIGLRILLSHLF